MRLAHTIALAVLAGAASALPTSAATLKVPQKFSTIQAALNAAASGDTVQVSPKPNGGVYNEALTISKPVVLQGKTGAILDGTGLNTLFATADGIDIRADHVAVRGLTIQNFTDANNTDTVDVSAISVGTFSADFTAYSNSDIEVSGCTIRGNNRGIYFQTYAGPNPFYPGGGASLKGYKILNNQITGNASIAVDVTTYLSVGGPVIYDANDSPIAVNADMGLTVSGNAVTNNGYDGIDTDGNGTTITGNESGGNAGTGVSAYGSDPKAFANPAPNTVALNYVHDNGFYGLAMAGVQTVSGNAVARNVGYGIYVTGFGNVSLNSVTGSVPLAFSDAVGQGIYATYAAGPSRLTIGANQVSGNAGDGITLDEVGGALVSTNLVTNNSGIGIHVTDAGPSFGLGPNTITHNVAQRNTPFDAQDDGAVEGYPLINVWTQNVFGTANPPSLKN